MLGSGTRTLAGESHLPRHSELDGDGDVGLDARYRLSSSLTLDLTANTDFAQVEADDQQVALDRFPLFFPERRRFFQEYSSLFDFVSAGGGRLFHSRRIGLTESGTPVTIFGGARLVGKAGAWDVGMLEMQADGEGQRPGENFGVLRLRRAVLNASSTAGMMLTTFVSGDRHNVALGADTTLRVYGDEYVSLKWAATHDEIERRVLTSAARPLRREVGDGARTRACPTPGSSRGPAPTTCPSWGSCRAANFTTANVVANWFIYADSTYFRRVYPGALAFSTFRNATTSSSPGQYAFWVQWDTKAGGGGWIEPKWFRENVLTPFTIGGSVHSGRQLRLRRRADRHTMPTGSRSCAPTSTSVRGHISMASARR